MFRQLHSRLPGAGLALALWAGAASGQAVVSEPELRPPGPVKVQRPSGQHTFKRAGNPTAVAWYAVPSDTGSYVGYYVGGGAPCRGEPRTPDEGTWGWDYQGWFLPRRVMLDWWHGRRYQGGIGHYRTVPAPNLRSPSTP
jgi:hypothetical protein